MNFINRVLAAILGSCYSHKFIFEDEYQDDDYECCCFYSKELDDLIIV
jgi:hypothetical protein